MGYAIVKRFGVRGSKGGAFTWCWEGMGDAGESERGKWLGGGRGGACEASGFRYKRSRVEIGMKLVKGMGECG